MSLYSDPGDLSGPAREAERQQMLLQTLWRASPAGELAGWIHDAAFLQRGLQAYQAHAGALAERALAAAYPTLQQLLGADSFAALARAYWQHEPPTLGDIGRWGSGLAAFVASARDLAEEPYLADVARLEWAVHDAASAADDTPAPLSLQQLLQDDPTQARLVARPGTQLVESVFPIVSIWQSHRAEAEAEADAERFAPVRQALAEQRAEPALVWRQGWRVQVAALGAPQACFTRLVLDGAALGSALQQVTTASADFDFQAWLVLQLQRGWLVGAAPSSVASSETGWP